MVALLNQSLHYETYETPLWGVGGLYIFPCLGQLYFGLSIFRSLNFTSVILKLAFFFCLDVEKMLENWNSGMDSRRNYIVKNFVLGPSQNDVQFVLLRWKLLRRCALF